MNKVGVTLLVLVFSSACDFFPELRMNVSMEESAFPADEGPLAILINIKAFDEETEPTYEGSAIAAVLCEREETAFSVVWSEQGICAREMEVTLSAIPLALLSEAAGSEADGGEVSEDAGMADAGPLEDLCSDPDEYVAFDYGSREYPDGFAVTSERYEFADGEMVPLRPIANAYAGCLDRAERDMTLR